MTQNAAEQPGAPRLPSFVPRKPPLYYKPFVIRIIHYLEQSEHFVVVQATPVEPHTRVKDDSGTATRDQA